MDSHICGHKKSATQRYRVDSLKGHDSTNHRGTDHLLFVVVVVVGAERFISKVVMKDKFCRSSPSELCTGSSIVTPQKRICIIRTCSCMYLIPWVKYPFSICLVTGFF